MRNSEIFFIGLFFCQPLSCLQLNQTGCAEFRRGVFSIHSEITSTNFLIKRNDSTQIQIEKETGKESEWKIDWVNDCEYNIYLLKYNYGFLESYHLKNAPSINYKIIKATDKYYIFQGTFDEAKMTDTIWRVK